MANIVLEAIEKIKADIIKLNIFDHSPPNNAFKVNTQKSGKYHANESA